MSKQDLHFMLNQHERDHRLMMPGWQKASPDWYREAWLQCAELMRLHRALDCLAMDGEEKQTRVRLMVVRVWHAFMTQLLCESSKAEAIALLQSLAAAWKNPATDNLGRAAEYVASQCIALHSAPAYLALELFYHAGLNLQNLSHWYLAERALDNQIMISRVEGCQLSRGDFHAYITWGMNPSRLQGMGALEVKRHIEEILTRAAAEIANAA